MFLAPRVLRIDLRALEARGKEVARVEAWSCADPVLERIGSWSGSATALAFLAARLRASTGTAAELPFLVAVGGGVRRGLPTAARASVIAHAPLAGRLGQGQVGGDLGERLAAVADLLVIDGRATVPGAVLVIDEGAHVELRSYPDLVGASPAATHERLTALLGPCASLRVGPGGERGIPFANLASGSAPQSFVGRGGLGAAFAAHGLKALVIRARPISEARARDASELVRRLRASPRLAARSSGGTFEQASALAARGALAMQSGHAPLDASAGADLEREGAALARGHHGCRGCPTPCGWVFEAPDGGARGGRFSALHPFVPLVGASALAESFQLLEVCDRLGLDAKEAGAALWVLERALELGRVEGHAARGDVRALTIALESIIDPASATGAALAEGAARSARRHGLEAESPLAADEGARPDTDLAVLLGQCVGARGPEPMRSFPFSLAAGASRARLSELLAPLRIPERAVDPRSPAGKGRIVWWHENFATAVDATGFCAFSAAALIADGMASPDELAEWIAPWALDRAIGATPGRALCAAGASLLALQIEIEERMGCARPSSSGPHATELALPGMRDEYERARGLVDGKLDPALAADLGSERLLERTEARFADEDARLVSVAVTESHAIEIDGALTPGTLVLASSGPLAEVLGREARLALALPAPLDAVVRAAVQVWPAAGRFLVHGDALLPAVYRGGERLGAEELVHAGERLELVVVIGGG
jgi:aldehyde:ferredoxin oxidoreductase